MQELSPRARQLFEAPNFGSPQVSPVWLDLEGRVIVKIEPERVSERI